MIGKKTGGRAAGTPNKLTSELRETLKAVIELEFATLPARLAELDPRERLDVLLKLLPFCLPKVETINGNYDEVSAFDWKF